LAAPRDGRMREQARSRMRRSYERLLEVVRATVRDAERVMAEITEGTRVAVSFKALMVLEVARAQVQYFLPLVARVIAQTKARVFGGDTHYPDKIFSLFEPHTEAIRKGKASKPTEFGKLVKIQEAENQIVVDYTVYDKRPDDQSLLLAAVAAREETFGKAPELVAADRGFWSRENKRQAKAAGVKKVCIPAQGHLSEEDRAEERQRWFRRAKRYRTGCEGRISVLKRRDELARCRYRGPEGMRRWTGCAVVSNNLWVLMNSAGN
jgi:IS5 family transposase